jgi:putative acetyltransferase
MTIICAESPSHIHEARRLFEEYGATLPPELWFEDFRQEVDGLPGEYGPPFGRLLLAMADDGAAAGCVALRRWDAGIGELKRMFVRPADRGRGIGKQLGLAVLDEALAMGYERVRLDTAPSMVAAIRLYERLGFRRIEPYRHYPVADVIFMEFLPLRSHSP